MKRILLVTLLLALAGLNFAQPQVQRKMFLQKKQVKGERMIDILDLTKEQQEKFDALHYEHQKKNIDVQAEIRKNQLEIRKLMDDDKPNSEKIKSLIDKNAELKSNLAKSRIDLWMSINNILDDEQKEIWKNHRGFGTRNFEGRFGRGDFGFGHKFRGGNPNCRFDIQD